MSVKLEILAANLCVYCTYERISCLGVDAFSRNLGNDRSRFVIGLPILGVLYLYWDYG